MPACDRYCLLLPLSLFTLIPSTADVVHTVAISVQPGHAWLSQHYKWALDRAFLEEGHSHVIIVEDDMLFSPDFLHFFESTAVLLDHDPTLWCVSTWNDNGLKSYDWDPVRMVQRLSLLQFCMCVFVGSMLALSPVCLSCCRCC